MNRIYIVMYHYIRDLAHSRYPKIKGLDLNLFRKQIMFFKQHFAVVTMEDVMEASKGSYQLPENALLLTFDDGYADHYTYALPILEEAGMQGSFFIPGKTFTTHQLLDVNKIHYILASADTEKLLPVLLEKMDFYRGSEFSYPSNEELFEEHAKANRFDAKETVFIKRILQTLLPEPVRNRIVDDLFGKFVCGGGYSEGQMAYELYMTEEQIRAMKRHGMFVGIHGYDHYWLGNLSEEKMKEDVDKALEIMDPFIDKKQWVMNYPYGNYNDGVLNYIRGKGACLGLTTKVAVADLAQHGLLELPRLDCNDFPPKSEQYKQM